ncbi:MAG TPA: methyltransferase domain-containing protein [Anaerolineales bacterium]|nr:methyltransferase domain-containing protein [Anaerolineales bacterium]
MNKQHYDLSIVIVANEDASNFTDSLPQIHSTLSSLSILYEIIIVLRHADEYIRNIVQQNNCILLVPTNTGYGNSILTGIHHSTGNYIITMDADQTHSVNFLKELWSARDTADVVVASRYITNGQAKMPAMRKVLSRLLNLVFSRGLDLPLHDMSSGFRLYKSYVIKKISTTSNSFDILQEVLVRILMEGYKISEIPYMYKSNDPAYWRMIQFGIAYIGTFSRLWKLRNSIASADYDARAYNAMMPPQRYWQRQRYEHITGMLNGKGRCLDVGCGSSRIIGALPEQSVALDILFRKLRYARRFGQATVQGSIFDLPVPDESFPCVLCSQVIEHVPRANVLDELDRVLQSNGYLILGTPDYAKWEWNVIEWLYKILLPQAYADEHITHYTFQELFDEFVTKRGYRLETTKYILQGELILGLRKPSRNQT